MNTLNLPFKKSLASIGLFVLSFFSLQAQDAKAEKATLIKNMVEAKNYVFIAETALPTRGRIRQLTSGYQLDVSPDTLNSDLPYFGRAYSAPIDPTKGGIEFTSTNFQYTPSERKKGGWSITIKPKDANDVNQLFLDILENGRATLQVSSNNRQPISFNGYIRERK